MNLFTELLLNYLLIAETDASFERSERRQSHLMRIWVEVEGLDSLGYGRRKFIGTSSIGRRITRWQEPDLLIL